MPNMTLYRRLKQRSRERFWRKYPKGSLLFVEQFFGGHKTLEEVKPKMMELRKRIPFGDLYILHGAAFQTGRTTTILCGPTGIGKSTLLRELVLQGTTPIDDGVILVGDIGNVPHVIETGTYHNKLPFSRLSKYFRARYLYQNPFLRSDMPDWLFSCLDNVNYNVSRALMLIGRQLSKDYSGQEFSPRVFKLDKVVFVTHERDKSIPMRIDTDYKISRFRRHLPLNPSCVDVAILRPWEDWANIATNGMGLPQQYPYGQETALAQ